MGGSLSPRPERPWKPPGLPHAALVLRCFLAAALGFPAAEAFGQSEGQAVTVTPEVRAAYREFRRSRAPLFFAISSDGGAFGFNFCPTPRPCRPATARANAIRLCERNSGGRPCQLYADSRRVIWTGPPVIGLDDGAEETAPD